MKNNVTLIGMPSAGKSTVGVLLAKRLGYSFIDVDLLIQEQEGKRLREIIEEQGLDGFLDVENRVNAGVPSASKVNGMTSRSLISSSVAVPVFLWLRINSAT